MNISAATKDSGIYLITNVVNGKVYVGSAVNLKQRAAQHESALRLQTHDNQHFQRAYNKYGAGNFGFRPILICAEGDLLFYEQRALDTYKDKYNIAKIAGRTTGYKMTEKDLATIKRGHEARTDVPRYEYAGELLTLTQLAELSGIHKATLRGRWARGWSIERSVEIPAGANVKKYLYGGRKYNIPELSELAAVPKWALVGRLEKGWDVAEAVETPPAPKAKKYLYQGSYYTARELSGKSPVKLNGFLHRMGQGMSVEEAVETPLLRKRNG